MVDGYLATFVVVPSAAVVVPATAPGSTSDREAAPHPAPPQTVTNRSSGGGGSDGGDMGRSNTRRSISTLLAFFCGTRYRVPGTWWPLAVSRGRVAGWHRCCIGSLFLALGCGIRLSTSMRTAPTYFFFFFLGRGVRGETARKK